MSRHLFMVLASGSLLLAACSSDDGEPYNAPGDSQTPPGGSAALDAWLAKGEYKSWACEPEPHENRFPSFHGRNRICSNAKLSAHTDGEYPVGAASVKELYGPDGQAEGFAVSLHVRAGNSGSDWYWYEKHRGRVAADGTGVPGCQVCHGAAGSDSEHSGHDFVYTQVR